jgi:hypothetical protein
MAFEAKANEVAEMLAKIYFKPSNGWLKCFIKVHKIIFEDVLGKQVLP